MFYEAICYVLFKGNAQFIFLCNSLKSLVYVCHMKILKSTVAEKVNMYFYNLVEKKLLCGLRLCASFKYKTMSMDLLRKRILSFLQSDSKTGNCESEYGWYQTRYFFVHKLSKMWLVCAECRFYISVSFNYNSSVWISIYPGTVTLKNK